MEIKVGKYYRTRDGRKVLIEQFNGECTYCFEGVICETFLRRTWTLNGRHDYTVSFSPHDLVAEWEEEVKEEPVSELDLGKVRPEDIETIDGEKVTHIIVLGEKYSTYKYLVVWEHKGGNLFDTADSSGRRNKKNESPDFRRKVKKIKYLKSIEQILRENPNAKFNENGWVIGASDTNIITPRMFRHFGKPLEDAARHFQYCSTWIEEREVKGEE